MRMSVLPGMGSGMGAASSSGDDEDAGESEMKHPGGDQAVVRGAGGCFGGEVHGG